MKLTPINLFVLGEVFKHANVVSNRLEAADFPHIKRCMLAGLLASDGQRNGSLSLTPAGIEARDAELAKRPRGGKARHAEPDQSRVQQACSLAVGFPLRYLGFSDYRYTFIGNDAQGEVIASVDFGEAARDAMPVLVKRRNVSGSYDMRSFLVNPDTGEIKPVGRGGKARHASGETDLMRANVRRLARLARKRGGKIALIAGTGTAIDKVKVGKIARASGVRLPDMPVNPDAFPEDQPKRKRKAKVYHPAPGIVEIGALYPPGEVKALPPHAPLLLPPHVEEPAPVAAPAAPEHPAFDAAAREEMRRDAERRALVAAEKLKMDPAEFRMPTIIQEKPKSSTAGRYYHKTNTVKLNLRVLVTAGDYQQTLIHEVAHGVVHQAARYWMKTGKRLRAAEWSSHGVAWKQAMRAMEVPPDAYHEIDVVSKMPDKFVGQTCACGKFLQISRRRLENGKKRGAIWSCMKCHRRLDMDAWTTAPKGGKTRHGGMSMSDFARALKFKRFAR